MHMDLSALRIFKTVVEEGGITKAADKLCRVQSNVTTRIKQLEDDLGQELFIREGKRLILAPAGAKLLEYTNRLLELAAEAEMAVRSPLPGGFFRLGAMESTAAVRLPAPLAAFGEMHPDVIFELQTGNPTQLMTALANGEIEAALVAEPITDKRFEYVTVFKEEPVIVTAMTAPAIDDKNGIPSTMIVFEQGCPHRQRLESWYAYKNDIPERTIELGSYHAMMGCVAAGMGAALLPKSVLKSFPEAKHLKQHQLPSGQDEIDTLLVWRRAFKTPNVIALIDILKEHTRR